MKLIQVLGPGCPKCQALQKNAAEAAKQGGIEAQIEKISDIATITSFGVMMTPALVVDGELKVMGKVATVDEIKNMLKA